MKDGDVTQAVTKQEMFAVIHALTLRKVQNKELWKLLMQPLIRNFNEGSISLRELSSLTYDLYIIKLQSPRLYEIIVDYFIKQTFNESDLSQLGLRVSVNFLHSLMYCHGSLKHEGFFSVMRRFIMTNIDKFNRFQLIKLLDIYKYNSHFMGGQSDSGSRLKQLLEAQLEFK